MMAYAEGVKADIHVFMDARRNFFRNFSGQIGVGYKFLQN